MKINPMGATIHFVAWIHFISTPHMYLLVRTKFSMKDLNVMLLSICEFLENWCRNTHTIPTGISKNLLTLSWNLRHFENTTISLLSTGRQAFQKKSKCIISHRYCVFSIHYWISRRVVKRGILISEDVISEKNKSYFAW